MKNKFKKYWINKVASDSWNRHLLDINFEINDILWEKQNVSSVAELKRLTREQRSRQRERDLILSM